MKKVLVLMLVLGCASMATAGLSLYVNGAPAETSTISIYPSDYIMIGVYSDGTMPDGKHSGAVILDPSALGQYPVLGAWTGATVDYDTVITGHYVVAPGGPVGIFYHTSAVLGEVLPAGLWSEFEFHCNGVGDIDILLADDAGAPAFLTIHQIPEPITMALLGLGGLFLRRRK